MANRLASAILLAFGTSTLFAACDDGDDRIDGMDGGEAGEAGKKTGGSSSGGSSAGKGGTQPVGGKAQGGQGPGAAGEVGMAGEGGETTIGGAPMGGGGGEGGTDGGATGMAGAGGSESPPVVHACGTATLEHRLCSAFIAAECENLPACVGDPPPDPCCSDCMAYTCPDCVGSFTSERPTFTECPACLAEYERNLLCSVEAFEAGNLSEGVACFDGVGAERTDQCVAFLFSAFDCLDYIVENECPASWPLE